MPSHRRAVAATGHSGFDKPVTVNWRPNRCEFGRTSTSNRDEAAHGLELVID